MHPQLSAIVLEFEKAQDRLYRLITDLPDERWSLRADPNRWSVAECVAHLNLTSRAYLPLIHGALERGRLSGRTSTRYHRDPVGWLLWRSMGPPVKAKVRTPAPFVPTGDLTREAVIEEFDALQSEQIACTRAAEGLPLGRLRIVSPFNDRLSYNLFSALSILPRHQHRHLWQAEQVWSSGMVVQGSQGGARG
jgi:hypothetical protein